MKNRYAVYVNHILLKLRMFAVILICYACKHDPRLDKLTIHENPLIKIISKPKVLLDHLNNPAAPIFINSRIVFAESGKGMIYEYKEKKIIPLIEGFGLDSYGGYPISVLGITSIPDKNSLIVAAAQDSGHVFIFNESEFPTKADKGREIELQRTESTNPFGIILVKHGTLLVATGGTKSVYQGNFDVVDPDPLKPVFDVKTGVEGLAEDLKTGNVYGAVVGSGQNDGSLIRWNPDSNPIQPQTIAEGFANLVGVSIMPNGLLLVLEFGGFDAPQSGRLSVIDPGNPGKLYPLISGLDSPSGFALGSDNTLLISTFGQQSAPDGMLISLKIDSKNKAR